MSEFNKYRVYKISIHILFFHYINDSKIYTIKPGKNAVLPGLKYSVITLLFGWWKFSIFKFFDAFKLSTNAIYINFSGGEDYTKLVDESDFDEKTRWIYNNLPRKISTKVNIETIDIIVELLEDCKGQHSENKITYINQNLKKINILNLFSKDVDDIIICYENYESRSV